MPVTAGPGGGPGGNLPAVCLHKSYGPLPAQQEENLSDPREGTFVPPVIIKDI